VTDANQRHSLQHALEEILGVSRVMPVGDGFSGIVFRTDNGGIVRVARTAAAARLHDLMLRVLPELASRLPVAIPVPSAVLPPTGPLPFGALTYPALPGTAATEAQMSPLIAGQLASFLAVLHHVDLSRFEAVPHHVDDNARWQEIREFIRPTCERVFSPGENRRLSAWWDRFLQAPERHHFTASLCHGDLWYENLLLDDTGGRITAVLDWEAINIGDPAQDLATLRHSGDAFARDVMNHYVLLSEREDPMLARRVQWFWEAREFHGMRLSIEQDDADELADTVAKIRRGPILRDDRGNA
jgi:aminoglycoside phosphotransferase (APT) family kinase protein